MKKTISFSTEVEVLAQSRTSCVVIKQINLNTEDCSYACAAEYLRKLIKEDAEANGIDLMLPVVYSCRMDKDCPNIANAVSDSCEYIIDCKHFVNQVMLTVSRITYEYK